MTPAAGDRDHVLRVLIVSESPKVWGAEQSLLTLLEEMPDDKMTFSVVVKNGSPLGAKLHSLGVDYSEHTFATSNEKSIFDPSHKVRSIVALLAMVMKAPASVLRLKRHFRDYDLIVGFSLWQCPEVLLASRLSRTSFVIDLHETIGGRLGTRVGRFVCTRAEKCIAVSDWVARRYSLPSDSYVVVPRPVKQLLPGPNQNVSPGRLVRIGIFGQLEGHKRVLDVVKAFGAVSNPGTELVVVGGAAIEEHRSDYERALQEIAKTVDNVQVIPRVDNVYGLMESCNFVLNFSEHEAFGRTMVEALAAGCIPVCVADSGPAEIIDASGVGTVLHSQAELERWIASLDLDDVRDLFSTKLLANRVAVSKKYAPEVVGYMYRSELATVVEGLS